MKKQFTTWAQFANAVDNSVHIVEGITTTDREEAEVAVDTLEADITRNRYNRIICVAYYVEDVREAGQSAAA